MDSNELEIQDKLRIEGVKSKGYGIIPQFIMQDNISKDAKAIYAYFCSYAGNGSTALPGRKTILNHLSISKDRYYKHLKELLENDYIHISQVRSEGQKFGRNIYTLIESPSKFNQITEKEELDETYNIIRAEGLSSWGYGLIPKLPMQDTRIDLGAKSLYAYLCSLSGTGHRAFPQKEQVLRHLNVSDKTYRKYLKQLILLNYIVVKQRKVNGKFAVNDCYMSNHPDIEKVENKKKSTPVLLGGKTKDTVSVPGSDKEQDKLSLSSSGKFPDTVSLPLDSKKQDTVFSFPNGKNQDSEKLPGGRFPDTRKQDTNIITNEINNNIYSHSLSHSDLKSELKENRGIPYQYSTDKEKMINAIHFLTEWETFREEGFQDPVMQSSYEMFNSVLIDMCCTKELMKLKGNFITYAKVIDAINVIIDFSQERYSIFNFAIQTISEFLELTKRKEIENIIGYLRSFIWDALITYKFKKTRLLADYS